MDREGSYARRELRDAMTFAVLCTDRRWNGETMGADPEDTDRRLDATLERYRAA